MYSDNIEYARTRLLGTVVMLDKEPVLVEDIDMDCETEILYLKDGSHSTCHVDDLDVVGQNKLGYINYEGYSYHMVRKPLRNDWRQGLRMGNMVFTGEQGFYEVPSFQLRATILGLYPTFQQAAEGVLGGHARKTAFSRHFAVNDEGYVLYKERTVGKFDKLIDLQEKFKYLTEYLNEVMEVGYAHD